jgi:hypothetical protein
MNSDQSMQYEVTYQIGGEEHVDVVEAPDAATAASRVRNAHQTDDGAFELLLVHLIEDESEEGATDESVVNSLS